MSELLPARNRTTYSAKDAALMAVREPSVSAGEASNLIDAGLLRLRQDLVRYESVPTRVVPPVEQRLYDSLSAIKVMTSQIAMHLDKNWRDKLFKRLDYLLGNENWEDDDTILQDTSFFTFLRMVLFLHPGRLPSLGVSAKGNLLADWTNMQDSVVLEFLPNDEVRWVLVRYLDGERESAAGQTMLGRLAEVLAPYAPERWFSDAG